MIYLIAFIIFALPSYLIKFSISVPLAGGVSIPTTFLEVLIYIATILTVIFSIKNKDIKPYLKAKKYFIPIILFILAGLISIFISADKISALGLFKAYIVDPILLFFVIIFNIKSKKDINLIINSLILSGVVVAIYAIYQRVAGDITSDVRVLSFYKFWPNASANYVGLYLAPILVLIAGYRSIREKLFKKNTLIFYDISFFVCLIAIYLTGSRAAAASVALGLLLIIFVKYWNYINKNLWLKILIPILIVAGLLFSYNALRPDFSLNETDGSRITSSNNIRWEIYKTTSEILKSNWLFGVGFGSYQDHFKNLTQGRINYPEYIAPYALTPHNLFLNIWVNLGLLGILAFIWILYIYFRQSVRGKELSIVLGIVMISIIAYGVIDTPYWKNDLSAVFWLIVGLVVVLKNSKYILEE